MDKLIRSFVYKLKDRISEPSPLIQIVMGPRQVGKTTGVTQLLSMIPSPSHYVSADNVVSTDHAWLTLQWQSAVVKGSDTILVIDEVQKIDQWAEIIKQFWDDQQRRDHRIKVILLGSSSLVLSLGATESLAGRFELVLVNHWDYVESNTLREMDIDTYLAIGGYPKSYDYINDIERWGEYVKYAIIDRVIDKDILNTALVRKPALFRQSFEILCAYPSQEISFRKLLGQLQDQGNTDLIKHYISLFESAYLFKALQKYSRQPYVTKSTSPKILPLCPCFYTLFSPQADKGAFVFESSVGAKLLQMSPDLYYWRQGHDEVDFVLRWRRHLIAIEVKSGRKRRATGLDMFMREFPEAKPVIITRDNYISFVSDPIGFFEMLI